MAELQGTLTTRHISVDGKIGRKATWGLIEGDINDQEDLIEYVEGEVGDVEDDLTAHTSNVSNPHSVTKAQVGLGNVDNTSDLNKPISTATQTALNGKIDDVWVNGTTVVETVGTQQIAKVVVPTLTSDLINDSGYVTNSVNNLTNYYNKTSTDSLLGNKVDKVQGKGLSTNDYTTAEKTKLSGIEDGATKVTKTSDITNDSGFITDSYHDSTKQDVIDDLSTIRSGATLGATSIQPNDNVSELTNDAGYLTQHQSLSNYYTKSETDSEISSHHDATKQDVISDLSSIRSGATLGSTSIQPNDNVSSLVNDAGYLTEHQSLSAYRTSANQDIIDNAIKDDVDAIEAKIPSQATSSNQLADKDFVNSSIATNTAYFKGTYNVITDLHLTLSATHAEIATALAGVVTSVTNNDYAFVSFPDATQTSQFTKYERYKYSTSWTWEFDLNNSSFTANQWATINSGLSSTDKTKLDGVASGAQVNVLEGVQINGTDLTITNKKVNVPKATNSSLGLIKGSSTFSYNVDTNGELVGVSQNKDVVLSTGEARMIASLGSIRRTVRDALIRYDEQTSLTTAQKVQAQNNIGLGWDLLWTNSDTTVDFLAQTLTLNLSPYDKVVICCRSHKGLDYYANCFCEIGKKNILAVNNYDNDFVYKRNAQISTSNIVFTDGMNTASLSYGSCIPYQIYGIKQTINS